MKLYGGIDLHSTNCYVVLLDEEGKIHYQKRLENDLQIISKELEPYKERIEKLVIESTYNWYWLADGLMEANYNVRLANTSALNQYEGLKYTDDKSDARWIADLLRLKILAEGHIYPKEKRGMRELLRRRIILAREQTRCLLGVQAMVTRYEGIKLSATKIKESDQTDEELLSILKDADARLAALSQLKVLRRIMVEVAQLEKTILEKVKADKAFQLLKEIPGIGPILAMTILLETGEIDRFKAVGNYTSYCRCVGSERLSNGKKKGENNRKNGNAYLSWAFIEAANYAIRFDETIKRYYQRKLSKSIRVVALKTVASKLTRACFFIMRDGAHFDIKKAFG